jgi:hypothetical protein
MVPVGSTCISYNLFKLMQKKIDIEEPIKTLFISSFVKKLSLRKKKCKLQK